jgi:hypothetical protein
MVESETVNIRNEEYVHSKHGRNTESFTSIVKFQLLWIRSTDGNGDAARARLLVPLTIRPVPLVN